MEDIKYFDEFNILEKSMIFIGEESEWVSLTGEIQNNENLYYDIDVDIKEKMIIFDDSLKIEKHIPKIFMDKLKKIK